SRTFINIRFLNIRIILHSLTTLEVFLSGVPNFPEFTTITLVDGVQISRCDSSTKRAVPKQSWMTKMTADDPLYWDRETQRCIRNDLTAKIDTDTLLQRFNESGGIHTNQKRYGCQWDDETDEIHGFAQFGFDGKDLIFLDLRTDTWVAVQSQALPIKLLWDRQGAVDHYRNFLTRVCPETLKKILRFGQSSLKKVLPEVSLLQKSPSSTVTCHATGFYPDRAKLFWTKDGEVLEDIGETLPNGDGTFQSFVDLDLSSVPAEDWDKVSCVFQLSGVRDDLITKLQRDKIKTNGERETLTVYCLLGLCFVERFIMLFFSSFNSENARPHHRPCPRPLGCSLCCCDLFVQKKTQKRQCHT
uniref:Ig-like domain-containing protein n=1 Tax=Neogobius melanostomus TaxID=47308 RepID=A0A8C6U0J7_9GOBI